MQVTRKTGRFLLRLVVYLSGFVVFSLGTALSIHSTLGVTAVTSLPLALSAATGFTVGHMMSFLAAVYVLGQALLLRREFQLINVGQIAIGMWMGFLVDFLSRQLSFYTPAGYPQKLLLTLISLPLISLGLSLIINARLLPSPSEGFTLAVAHKLGKPFPHTKVVLDCITLGLALLVFLATAQPIHGIREGTLINAVSIGFMIGLYNRLLKPLYACITAGSATAKEAA